MSRSKKCTTCGGSATEKDMDGLWWCHLHIGVVKTLKKLSQKKKSERRSEREKRRRRNANGK